MVARQSEFKPDNRKTPLTVPASFVFVSSFVCCNPLSLRERARVRVNDNSVIPVKPVLVKTGNGYLGVRRALLYCKTIWSLYYEYSIQDDERP